MPSTSLSTGSTGSRKISSQYRPYRRMTSRDAARMAAPLTSGPSTRTRLASSTWTRGPWRRQARSAKNRKARSIQRSGSRQTRLQPAP